MAGRRANRPEIRRLIAAVKIGGWMVDDPIGKSNIYKARCHCGNHLEHIHSTPSGPNYARNKLMQMKRTCWAAQEEV